MKDLIKAELEQFQEVLTFDLFNHEANFNNADTTSGQRVYTEAELRQLIKETILGVLR